jgi:hypothetical protein
MESMVDFASNDNMDRQLLEEFERTVLAILPSNASFAEREQLALRLANELVRRHLQNRLQQMAQAQPIQVVLDDVLYRRHQPGQVAYNSLCGPLWVDRWTYRPVGVRNGPTRVPLELAAGLIESATPQLAKCVAQGYAKAPIRSVEQDLHAAHRSPPSRCTLERMALAIGTQVKKVAQRLEHQIRTDEVVPDNAVAINLGLDRTSIPMAEDGPVRPASVTDTPKAASRHRQRVLRYRMGYVGTVTLTDAEGETLVTRRYAAPAHVGPDRILERMMADLRLVREQKPELRIAVVQDGAPELWTLMGDALRAELKLGPRAVGWHEIIDRYHLMQHLAEGLELVVPKYLARVRKLEQWRRELDQNDRAIVSIHRWFDRVARKRRRWDKMNQVVGRYICIFRRFRYASAKKRGLHQGSGVTEGACKTLITKRTKRSGQRWRPRGISAVLALRSLLESDRLDRFWPLFAARYQKLPVAA